MESIRAKILKFVLGLTNNLNPEKVPNAIEKIKKFSNLMMNEKVPNGFELEKLETQKGTKFQIVHKKDMPKTEKIILYFHGGAYISGLISHYRTFAKDFYNSCNADLVLLDYKTAPEFKYPSQLNEALDLWEYLTENMGYKPENIILGGDSAGGNLTLAMMLKLRDENKKLPKAAFCMSPWADMTASGSSYLNNYQKDILFGEKDKEVDETIRRKFLNSEIYCFIGDADRKDPYVSPVFGEYYDFPPMMFTVGEYEMLLSDTLTIVKNLKENNVPVSLEIKPAMFHTYTIYGAFMPEAVESFEKILEFINLQFLK